MNAPLILPNVRKLFLADPGYAMFEADLKGADAQVVAWEMDDDDLKKAFRAGVDIHSHNAEAMWGSTFTRLEKGSHARDNKRQECKHTVHGVHYGCTPRTTAIQRGWTVHEAEHFHRRWMSLHPGVERWHNSIKKQLAVNRTVENRFGFRRIFFGRIESSFTEALAWVPQSTVALNTYHGALQLERHYWPEQLEPHYMPDPCNPEGMILQTHDSINFQFKLSELPTATELQKTLAVEIPYNDPLTIQWDLKMSTKSWGEMEKYQ